MLIPANSLTLEEMTDAVAAVIPEAYAIEELPGATIETCGGYQEHDFADAKAELKLLADAELVPLTNPPFLS